VFFEASRNGRPPVAQAFVFISNAPTDDIEFAKLHKRLWSWGGVPLLYRKTNGLVQLFRCAHKPDFVAPGGELVCHPVRTLDIAGTISSMLSKDPWWDSAQIRNGTLWDVPSVCDEMLKVDKAAHKSLIAEVQRLNTFLNNEGVLKPHLRRKLLILSLLIAYLEDRGVFGGDYFARFQNGATKFFEVLRNGKALVSLLKDLERRFNGHVFVLDAADRDTLRVSSRLDRFARLIEARQEQSGQYTLWQLYSFGDLPVELISHIYQLFVTDTESSIYTPPFLVRLMLEEALSWERLDRLEAKHEIILDPSCGSGIFLVEAYKRLVLHWRSRNNWQRPRTEVLKRLVHKVRGIDLDKGAVELAAFSLCLALCESLQPETIRRSIKLFPPLEGTTLHHTCFFEAKEKGLIKERVGVVVGNPPFKSGLRTPGARRSYEHYELEHGSLPDKQLSYLFLHEAMELVTPGGLLSMIQQYGFLYNQHSAAFRRDFMKRWNVRELLDFISVRGLFQKGNADTKVLVVLAEAAAPSTDGSLLHVTFRRTGRVDSEQGFDVDYYDFHRVPREIALTNDNVWRCNLLGGVRALAFVDRLKILRTIQQYASEQGWDHGEGFIEGQSGNRPKAPHLTGKPLLPSEAISDTGIDRNAITTVEANRFKTAYQPSRFSPPMILIREQMDIAHGLWTESYLTYKNKVVGICAKKKELSALARLNDWIRDQREPLKAFVAAISVRMFTQKATTLSEVDILSLPYPESRTLEISANEQIIVDDIVKYYRDLVRLGNESEALTASAQRAMPGFVNVFIQQINAIYKANPLRGLDVQSWPGVICQPFVFGNGRVEWTDAQGLIERLGSLLHEQKGSSIHITRIARIYDGNFVFLLKPDRLRYWLRSVALQDADEMLADLREQGF